MEDKRLFHRYPAGVRVAFRFDGKGYRGKITNVSAGGGFVVTKARPEVGTRIQMAAQTERNQPTVWLDLRVTWAVEEPTSSHPRLGVGGYWLHASSRHGEDHLRDFLSNVLGITKPVVRPMSPPAGGDVVFVYRFPNIYEGDELDELPWVEPRARVSRAARKGSGRRRRSTSDSAVSRLSGRSDDSSSPAALNANTQILMSDLDFDEGSSADLEVGDAPDVGPGGPAGEGSRWTLLVRKLTGIRSRARSASGSAPTVTLGEDATTIQYKVGRKSYDAELRRIGASWVVFRPVGKVPEVWSRIVVLITADAGGKDTTIEVHATVTRLKKGEADIPIVHCKINKVDEKGQAGAYGSYVDAFNASR